MENIANCTVQPAFYMIIISTNINNQIEKIVICTVHPAINIIDISKNINN